MCRKKDEMRKWEVISLEPEDTTHSAREKRLVWTIRFPQIRNAVVMVRVAVRDIRMEKLSRLGWTGHEKMVRTPTHLLKTPSLDNNKTFGIRPSWEAQ
jgi:hypothetical protein